MANAKKTVLVVQQKNDWRDLLVHVIERCGYNVIAATNLETITGATISGLYLILVDLDSLNDQQEVAITQLQKDPWPKHIPIVCEARYGNDLLVRRAIQAGAKGNLIQAVRPHRFTLNFAKESTPGR